MSTASVRAWLSFGEADEFLRLQAALAQAATDAQRVRAACDLMLFLLDCYCSGWTDWNEARRQDAGESRPDASFGDACDPATWLPDGERAFAAALVDVGRRVGQGAVAWGITAPMLNRTAYEWANGLHDSWGPGCNREASHSRLRQEIQQVRMRADVALLGEPPANVPQAAGDVTAPAVEGEWSKPMNKKEVKARLSLTDGLFRKALQTGTVRCLNRQWFLVRLDCLDAANRRRLDSPA